jgi:hypothetical protein
MNDVRLLRKILEKVVEVIHKPMSILDKFIPIELSYKGSPNEIFHEFEEKLLKTIGGIILDAKNSRLENNSLEKALKEGKRMFDEEKQKYVRNIIEAKNITARKHIELTEAEKKMKQAHETIVKKLSDAHKENAEFRAQINKQAAFLEELKVYNLQLLKDFSGSEDIRETLKQANTSIYHLKEKVLAQELEIKRLKEIDNEPNVSLAPTMAEFEALQKTIKSQIDNILSLEKKLRAKENILLGFQNQQQKDQDTIINSATEISQLKSKLKEKDEEIAQLNFQIKDKDEEILLLKQRLSAASEPVSLSKNQYEPDDDGGLKAQSSETNKESISISNQEFLELKLTLQKLEDKISMHGHLNFKRKTVNKIQAQVRKLNKVVRRKRLRTAMIFKMDTRGSLRALKLMKHIEEDPPVGLVSRNLIKGAEEKLQTFNERLIKLEKEQYKEDQVKQLLFTVQGDLEVARIAMNEKASDTIMKCQDMFFDLVEEARTKEVEETIDRIAAKQLEELREKLTLSMTDALAKEQSKLQAPLLALNEEVQKLKDLTKGVSLQNEFSNVSYSTSICKRPKRAIPLTAEENTMASSLTDFTEYTLCLNAIKIMAREYAGFHVINTTKFSPEKLEYFNPLKRMPYDSRMSQDEWDLQKNRNRDLVGKFVDFPKVTVTKR